MGEKKQAPDHAIVVQTYAELRQLVQAFAEGHHELMTLVGSAGVGKSETVTRRLQEIRGGNGWTMLKGKHSPLDLYARLYQSRSRPIVLDDLDGLLSYKNNTALLKCVCDTKPVKRVEWGSYHRAFNGRDGHLPRGFESISRVCILANDFHTLNANISAVHDRGVLILFQPDAAELHREIAQAGWFDDEEVFDFIGHHLFLVARPSFRLYITARNHKRSGLDWRGLLLRMLGPASDQKLILVAQLMADHRFAEFAAPETAREREFRRLGGGSRATYHRYKRKLLKQRGKVCNEAISAIRLGPVQPDLMYAAMYDRRQQLEEMVEEPTELCEPNDAEPNDTAGAQDGDDDADSDDEVSQLRKEMQRAIRREDYELAAKLRDEIKRREKDE